MMKEQCINVPDLSVSILKKMNTLRHNKMFYDVTLEIDKQIIYAHKSVLSACSQYFLTLFQKEDLQKNDGQISHYSIDFVTKKDFYILENLINFIYTQSMQVSPSDIAAMYTLASKLKISQVSARLALNFLDNLSVQTCIGMRKLAGIGNDPQLAQSLDKFIGDNFGEIINQPEYLALPRINVYVQVKEARGGDKTTQDLGKEERNRFQMKIIDYVLKYGPETLEGGTDSPAGSNRSLSPKFDSALGPHKGGLYLSLDRSRGNLTHYHQKTASQRDKQMNGADKAISHRSTTSSIPCRPLVSNNNANNHKNNYNNIYDGLNPLVELPGDVFDARDGQNYTQDTAAVWSLIAFDESKKNLDDILITALVAVHPHEGRLLNFRIKLYQEGSSLSNGTDSIDAQTPTTTRGAHDDSSLQPRDRELNGYPAVVENGMSSKALTNGWHHPDSADQTGPTGLVYQPCTESADQVSARPGGGLISASLPQSISDLVAPMRSPRCGMGAVELSGKMLVCGGYDRGECLNSSEIYDPYTNTWSPFANMLGPRGRMDMAVLDGKVYVMGGSNGSTELNSAECFDLGTQSWNTLSSPMPQHCSNAGLAVLNKRIYCVGGQCGRSILKDVFVFDILTKAWSPVRPLNTARYQACVASLNDKLFVVGGSNNWNCLNSVEIYDATADAWTLGPPIQTPRRGAGIAMYRDKLYVIGGTDGTKVLPSVEIYDEGRNGWSFGPKLNVPRVNVKLVVVGDVLYAVGGFSGKSFLNSIEYLNPDLNQWTMVAPPPLTITPTQCGPAQNLTLSSKFKMASPVNTEPPHSSSIREDASLGFPSSSFNPATSGESIFLMHAPTSVNNPNPTTPIK